MKFDLVERQRKARWKNIPEGFEHCEFHEISDLAKQKFHLVKGMIRSVERKKKNEDTGKYEIVVDDDGNPTYINEAWFIAEVNGSLWCVSDKCYGSVDIAREMEESGEAIEEFLTLKMEKTKGVSFPVPVFMEFKA